jgi:hypothetical protein
MPKEIIHGETLIGHPDASGNTEVRHPVVEVRWNDHGDVQLVTREHGHEVPTLEEHEGGIPQEYGYWVSLDRRGINDTIRKLRRARDRAFGRDE